MNVAERGRAAALNSGLDPRRNRTNQAKQEEDSLKRDRKIGEDDRVWNHHWRCCYTGTERRLDATRGLIHS